MTQTAPARSKAMRSPDGDQIGLRELSENVSRLLPLPSGRTVKMSERSSGPGLFRTYHPFTYAIRPLPPGKVAPALVSGKAAAACWTRLPDKTPTAITMVRRAALPRLSTVPPSARIARPYARASEMSTRSLALTQASARNPVVSVGTAGKSGRVTSYISHTSIDCRDAYQLSEWWKQVLDYVDVEDDPNEPGHEECMILRRDGGHHVLFIEVPEGKTDKNRIHFDLRPPTAPSRRRSSGCWASVRPQAADRRGLYGPGSGWVTLADPEGNEFCVLRSAAEAGRPG